MPDSTNQSPVLFLVFNRPNTTAMVMEAIRAARPPKLYIAADGPRDRPGDEERCDETRRIATAVDWPCTVRTLFRESHLGLRQAVSSALDWFFEQEEEGIMLEDDCVPCASFFFYCSELLNRYRSDSRIMCVGGGDYSMRRYSGAHSYYLSAYIDCWGWATWRRAWSLYDRDMQLWPEFRDRGLLKSWSGGDVKFEKYWSSIFEDAAAGRIDSWAYRFQFSCWAQGGLTCIPKTNLVSNIGFGPEATHTKAQGNPLANMPTEELEFPLLHPPVICRDARADAYTQQFVFNGEEEQGLHRSFGRVARAVVRPGRILERGSAQVLRRVLGI